MCLIDSQTTSLTLWIALLNHIGECEPYKHGHVWNSKETFQILQTRCDLKQQATEWVRCTMYTHTHTDDLAFCCWHCSLVQATSCQKYWDGVIMVPDRTGIPCSASGHHDDSTVWSTLGWWDELRNDGRWDSDVSWLGRPVETGDRHYSPLFPLLSLLAAPPNPPHCCRAPWIIPETNADEHLFPWWPRACCKDCRKAFSLTLLCVETMVLRPTPPWFSLPLHTPRLSRGQLTDAQWSRHLYTKHTVPSLVWIYTSLKCKSVTGG